MKKILLASMILFAGIFVSCNNEPDGPVVATPQNTVEALLHYYPYQVGEQIDFVNESNGMTWYMTPMSVPGTVGEWPNPTYQESTANDQQQWLVQIGPRFEGAPEPDDNNFSFKANTVIFSVVGDKNENSVTLECQSTIRLSKKEHYLGIIERRYTLDNFLSTLEDTIRVPIVRNEGAENKRDIPDGCYINIVKDKGITDFCVDGKTVWKRKQ